MARSWASVWSSSSTNCCWNNHPPVTMLWERTFGRSTDNTVVRQQGHSVWRNNHSRKHEWWKTWWQSLLVDQETVWPTVNDSMQIGHDEDNVADEDAVAIEPSSPCSSSSSFSFSSHSKRCSKLGFVASWVSSIDEEVLAGASLAIKLLTVRYLCSRSVAAAIDIRGSSSCVWLRSAARSTE